MRTIFLCYNQLIHLKINIVSLKKRISDKKNVEFVLNVNKAVTQESFQTKREKIDPQNFDVLNRVFSHSFPIKEYSELEKHVLGPFFNFYIYADGKCIISKMINGAVLCERKRFVERKICDYLDRYLNYQIKFLSGASNPDIILKDPLLESEIQCEITETDDPNDPLSFEKFSKDVQKYERYQIERRFPKIKHLLILPCTNGVAGSITERHIKDFTTILPFNDLYNLLYCLKDKKAGVCNRETVKNFLENPGIQKAPVIYCKTITPFNKEVKIEYTIDLREKEHGSSSNRPLLYIRDISIFEVIKILQLAKKYKEQYISRKKFISILLEPANLEFINKQRAASKDTDKARISKEWWLITPLQLGYLDENFKITDRGLFILELLSSGNKEKLRKQIGYDFLKSQGIVDFLKLMNKTYNDPFYKREPSRSNFLMVMSKRMEEVGLAANQANAKKDFDNIVRWLNELGYSKGILLDPKKIQEDYTLSEEK